MLVSVSLGWNTASLHLFEISRIVIFVWGTYTAQVELGVVWFVAVLVLVKLVLARQIDLRLVEDRDFGLLGTLDLVVHIYYVDAWNNMVDIRLSHLANIFTCLLRDMNLCLSFLRCRFFSLLSFFLLDPLIQNFLKSSEHVNVLKMRSGDWALKLLSAIIIIVNTFVVN